MTEKEKKAIDEIRNWRNYIVKNKEKVNRANDIEFYLRTVLNLIQNLQEENNKKDKIIDLMAYDIAINDSNLCQYIDETIRCKKYAGENKLTCDECIKQYFKKVSDGDD